MRTMVLSRPAPIDSSPLELREIPDPEPGPGEVRVRVLACGICRTDLHVVEAELPPVREHDHPRASGGWNGGPARARTRRGSTSATASASPGSGSLTGSAATAGRGQRKPLPERPLHRLHRGRRLRRVRGRARRTSPMRCRRPSTPSRRRRCCARGSSATAHSAAGGRPARLPARAVRLRLVRPHRDPGRPPHGMHGLRNDARRASPGAGPPARRRLGRRRRRRPPEPLDSACCSRPSVTSCRPRSDALDKGGTLAVAGIYLTDIPPLNYERHLFHEKNLRSVTANTRRGREGAVKIGGGDSASAEDDDVSPGRGESRPPTTEARRDTGDGGVVIGG